MTPTERRPGDDDRGGADDLLDSWVGTEDTAGPRPSGVPQQIRRRRAASLRLPPLPSGDRDPWRDRPAEWLRELDSLIAAAEHLSALGLYGRWQSPTSARQAWSCQRCPCQPGEAA